MSWKARSVLVTALIFASPSIEAAEPTNRAQQVDVRSRSIPPAKRRYCAAPPMVGAWIADRPCRTRAEWRRDAIDLLGPR